MKRRAWITLGAVVLGGGGVATYAVAGPSSEHGQAKRPVKVYDLTLKSTAGGKRELPRTQTEQFSLLGVSWKDAGKRLQARPTASWVASRASTSGQPYVYVDGVKVSTVDLKSSTTLYRQAIWTKTWSSSAKHTVKIVVVGTSGRPAITTDGLVYIK